MGSCSNCPNRDYCIPDECTRLEMAQSVPQISDEAQSKSNSVIRMKG